MKKTCKHTHTRREGAVLITTTCEDCGKVLRREYVVDRVADRE